MNAALFQIKSYSNASALLPRIARADQTAIQECVNSYGSLIWALAKQMTGSASEAEKAVPEIFMDIWKNAAFYDSALSEEAVWIAMVARRRLSEYRAQKHIQATAAFLKEIAVKELKAVQLLH